MKKDRVIGVFGSAADVALFSGAVSKIPGFKVLPLTQPQQAAPKTVRLHQPSPDGNDEGEGVTVGSGQVLSDESFLPKDEQVLRGVSFGQGPTDPAHPNNDA